MKEEIFVLLKIDGTVRKKIVLNMNESKQIRKQNESGMSAPLSNWRLMLSMMLREAMKKCDLGVINKFLCAIE